MPQTRSVEDEILIDLFKVRLDESTGDTLPISRYADKQHAIANLVSMGYVLMVRDELYITRKGQKHITSKYPMLWEN